MQIESNLKRSVHLCFNVNYPAYCSFCYSCCFVAFATRFQIKQTDE